MEETGLLHVVAYFFEEEIIKLKRKLVNSRTWGLRYFLKQTLKLFEYIKSSMDVTFDLKNDNI